MNISVIILTSNAEKYLPKLFEACTKQTITFELIIIDSSSTTVSKAASEDIIHWS